ncbi:MAG: uroporphyrinogen-III C-methyltransferase [Burkholderiaceae bacterium]
MNDRPPMKRVAFVGAGPGAADLITMRGLRYLQTADCILHDALVSADLLALLPAAAEIIEVGKRCGKPSAVQSTINTQLVTAARRHARVVRLKGGDPMIFGRTAEEMAALDAAAIDFEIVPGITAALAAAASLRKSLTLRGVARSVALITPAVGVDENPHDVTTTSIGADTLAVYMGLNQARIWAARLLQTGWSDETPVIVCESISTAHESFDSLSLAGLAGLPEAACRREGPTLILIGRAL